MSDHRVETPTNIDETFLNALHGIISTLGASDAVNQIDQPHVAGCYDPEASPANIAEYMTLVHGPYPDLMSALEAAETNAAELNALNNPGETAWEPFVLPITSPRTRPGTETPEKR